MEILTPRERQVADCMFAGMSNKETGSRLNISVRTVEIHRGRVLAKTKCKNAADFVSKHMRLVLEARLGAIDAIVADMDASPYRRLKEVNGEVQKIKNFLGK